MFRKICFYFSLNFLFTLPLVDPKMWLAIYGNKGNTSKMPNFYEKA